MFSYLVESGPRRAEARRKGKYFISTLALYALLLVTAGVGSIYAYNVRVEDGADYELVAMMRFADEPAAPQERQERRPAARAASPAAASTRPPTVTALAHNNPHLQDREVAAAGVPTVSPRVGAVIGPVNDLPSAEGGYAGPVDGPVHGISGRDTGPVLSEPFVPPPAVNPTPAPTPKQEPRIISLPSSVISGKALDKPAPPYPPLAKAARVQGTVAVMVVVDEQGRVVSARATGGPVMLQTGAVQAAYRARFSPTLLSGQPVKVTGVITYNFVLQP